MSSATVTTFPHTLDLFRAPHAYRQQERSVSSPRATNHPTQEVFSRFLRSRQDHLLRTAMRVLRNREDALDVLQEVALKAYQHWHSLNHEANVDGWLYRVTINECYRCLQKKPAIATEAQKQSKQETQSAPATQEQRIDSQQFQAFLSEALLLLSAQERLAFILRDIEQRSGKEIAQWLNCQPTTARGYYFAARKKLASHIEAQAPEWLSLLGRGESS